MKTMRNLFTVVLLGLVLLFQACTEGGLNNLGDDKGILPKRFKIDIPNSISNDQSSGLKSATNSQADTMQGNEIYAHLNNFIAIGEGAADIVQDIIFAIALYDIDLRRPVMSFSVAQLAERVAGFRDRGYRFAALPDGLSPAASALLEAPEGSLLLLTEESQDPN